MLKVLSTFFMHISGLVEDKNNSSRAYVVSKTHANDLCSQAVDYVEHNVEMASVYVSGFKKVAS